MTTTRLYDIVTHYLDEAEETYQSPEGDTDDRFIVSDITGDHGNWRVFIRIVDNEDAHFVVIRALHPVRVPEINRLKVAELLTRINCELITGNYEFNMDDGEVNLKNSIDFVDGVLTPAMFEQMYGINCHVMNENYDKILKVGYGVMEPAKAAEKEAVPDGVVIQ